MLLNVALVLAIWPWMGFHRPEGAASGRTADLIVVLDGGTARLQQAENFRQQVLQEHPRPGRPPEAARLLIRCPRVSPPREPCA